MEKVKLAITNHADIPDGCMLVISEKMLGQMYFNSGGGITTNVNSSSSPDSTLGYNTLYGSGFYGNRYRYKGASSSTTSMTWSTTNNAGGDLYNYINNLFSKNTSGTILKNSLAFTQAQADLIVPQKLYTTYHNGSSMFQETFETDGGTYYTMFPLAYRGASSSIYQNFCVEDYMTTNAQRATSMIGSNYTYASHYRSGTTVGQHGLAHWSGALASYNLDCTYGVRPAMVMRLQ